MSPLRVSLLLLLALLSACARNTPESVADRYWQAVIANDEEAIRQSIASSSSPSLSTVIHPSPESRVTFGPTERQEETAQVATTIHWVDGEETATFDTETMLVLEEGEWKVEPALTRQAFFDSVYSSAITGLEAALEESAEAFRELGSELSETMARELSAASRELQEQTEKANQEIRQFLEELDEELRKELEKRN